MAAKLPIHGFVLAGGQSSRMGTDKAMLGFRGQPMIAIAVETLTAICEFVSISGSRSDLAIFANVIPDSRSQEGPAGGIEAGLLACATEWAMFLPVDLPLIPPYFLRMWAETVFARPQTRASYIVHGPHSHPALCLLRRDCVAEIIAGVHGGNRRLESLLGSLDGLWIADAYEVAGAETSTDWFANINTPEELMRAESAEESSRKRGN